MPGPLTLADMRAEGIRHVTIDCPCNGPDIVNVDHLREGMAVPDVRYHVRCPGCGNRPLRTTPHWKEQGGRPGYPV